MTPLIPFPLAPFEEAEGDVAYVEAVRQAVVDHRYVYTLWISQSVT